jgi:hypothetical protein
VRLFTGFTGIWAARDGAAGKAPIERTGATVAVFMVLVARLAVELAVESAPVFGYRSQAPDWALAPGVALAAVATWLVLLAAWLTYMLLAYGPPSAGLSRLPARTVAALVVAAWPIALISRGESWFWRRLLYRWPHHAGFPLGLQDLIDACKGVSPVVSAAALFGACALGALQVFLLFGMNVRPREESDVRKRMAVGPLAFVMLYLAVDSVGFPLSTTAALVAAHVVTGSIAAPITLVLGVCFFLWL